MMSAFRAFYHSWKLGKIKVIDQLEKKIKVYFENAKDIQGLKVRRDVLKDIIVFVCICFPISKKDIHYLSSI